MKSILKRSTSFFIILAICFSTSFISYAYEEWLPEMVEKCFIYGGYTMEETCEAGGMTEEDFKTALNALIESGLYTETGIEEIRGESIDEYLKTVTSNKIPDLNISGIENKTYTGKKITLSIVMKKNSTVLRKGTDYTVTYKNNTKIGKASVTIKGKGKYTGSVTKTFSIIPKTVKLIAIKADEEKKVTLQWNRNSSVTGYKIYYATSENGKYTLLKTIKGNKTTKYRSKALETGTSYYFKIATYKSVNGKDYISKKSTEKVVKITGKTTIPESWLGKYRDDREECGVLFELVDGGNGEYVLYTGTFEGTEENLIGYYQLSAYIDDSCFEENILTCTVYDNQTGNPFSGKVTLTFIDNAVNYTITYMEKGIEQSTITGTASKQ